jgi:putative transposase
MREIYNAEDIDKAQVAIKAFEIDYGAKYPKAVAKIVDDADVLLEFYTYPAEHWVHLRTTNPIESTFATVRLRTKVTKGPGSRAAGLAMAYKLIEALKPRGFLATVAVGLLVSLSACGSASKAPESSAAATPSSSDTDATREMDAGIAKQLDAAIDQTMTAPSIPGAIIGVWGPGGQ